MRVFIFLVIVLITGCNKKTQSVIEKDTSNYKGKYLGALLELKDCEENYNSLWNASFNDSENIWQNVKFNKTAKSKTDTPVVNSKKEPKWQPKTPVEPRIQKELDTPCKPQIIYLPGKQIEIEKTPTSVVIALIVMGLTILALIIALIKKPAKSL